MLKIKCAAHPNVKVGERWRGRSVGVLLQRNVIYNSQPDVNTFISALMNCSACFERRRARVWRFSVLRSEKSYFPTRQREMRLGLAVASTFLQPFVGEATQAVKPAVCNYY